MGIRIGAFRASLCLLALAPVLAEPAWAAVAVSSGPVVRGEWNGNFTNVMEAARTANIPMVMVWSSEECPHCARLENVLEGETFHAWQKARALPMAFIRSKPKDEAHFASRDFAQHGSQDLDGYPYVCIWWQRKNGEVVKRNFSGRRGKMSAIRDPSLAVELISALDGALADYLTQEKDQRPAQSIVASCVKKISAKVEGESGKASVEPPDGALSEGTEVTLVARPRFGSVFVGWRNPMGAAITRHRRFHVTYDMPEGTYTACFRKRSACLPPVVTGPSTALCARVGKWFSYVLKVDDSTLPVRFSARGLPRGLSLDAVDGVISGTPKESGTNAVEIAFCGAERTRTANAIVLQIVVE